MDNISQQDLNKLSKAVETLNDPLGVFYDDIQRLDRAVSDTSDTLNQCEDNIKILASEIDETKQEIGIVKEEITSGKIKGDKGEKGDPGPAGKDGLTPIKGVDYFDGKDGVSVDKESVVKDVLARIPNPVNGSDGKDGSPDTPDQVIEKIIESEKLIPKNKVDGLEDIEKIAKANIPFGDVRIGVSKTEVTQLANRVLVLENKPSGTGGGHTIQDEGTPLTQRTNLNFVGATVTVTDDAVNDATKVTIVGDGTGDVVGPASAVDSNFASFNTTTGKLIKDSGKKASDFATAAQGALADTALQVETDPTIVAQTVGFTITKGTTPKTLTVPLDASVSGTNTGDQTLASLGAQAQLNGTGFVKASGTSISYDNSTYLTSVTPHNLLSTTHGDTTAGSVARGDLITGQGVSPTWTKLAIGTAGKLLQSDGTDIGWSTNALTIGASASVSGSNTGDQTNISGNAGTVTVADAGGDTTTWPLLGIDQTGSLSPRTDAGLTYNATTHALTATTFVGALTGTASGNLVSGGALGTPSSGTLTNCTGLPIAGLTASTSTALGVGSIELGHASDTTIARVSAGVVSIEGQNIVTSRLTILAATGTIDDANTAFTFTSQPTVLIINGGTYQQTGGSITWTWLAGTATLSSPVGVGGSLFGLV